MSEADIEKFLAGVSDKFLTKLDARLKAGPLTFPLAKLEPYRAQIEECLATFLAIEAFLNPTASPSA